MVLMIAGNEPQQSRGIRLIEDSIGLRAASCNQLRAQFHPVALRMAFGGLVETISKGEVAKITHLQKAGDRLLMIALPGPSQAKRGQDATMQIAKDHVAGHSLPPRHQQAVVSLETTKTRSGFSPEQ
jgi:hypothetical protein